MKTNTPDTTIDDRTPQQVLADALEKHASVGYDAPSIGMKDDPLPIPVMKYNPDEVEEFLATVFHTVPENGNVITWRCKNNTPFKPVCEKSVFRTLTQKTDPRTFYYGTSTVYENESGELRNKKDQFCALHVVVLDDIGTKIPFSALPKELEPNYIIETSNGNYQYGYILDKPITDLALAEALIHTVYTSGVSDEGGKMPTKVVRLPCGVNGKKGKPSRYDIVSLKELNDRYWSPEALLNALDTGVTWQDILDNPDNAKGGNTARMVGTSTWSAIKPVAGSLSGVVDQTLEWLYENGFVKGDNGEWVEVSCPWADGHTDGGTTAGYSPIGRGGKDNNLRGFHCFHGHCAGNKISQYLQHLSNLGAPEVPVYDCVADLVADYAFIESDDSVARIRGVRNPTFMKMGAFNNAFPRTAKAFEFGGKLIKQSEAGMWRKAPNRLRLAGRLYDPTNKERITHHDSQDYLNTYSYPDWGNGNYDEKDVTMFKEFLEYLIPVKEEREYFWEWLAAKAQNPTFKGAALLMVAPTQGTGRTTLTDMITELFTQANVNKVTFNQLIAGGDAGMFNAWQESSIVTCDEVMAHGNNKYHTYETLKDMFDPRPKKVKINEKYGTERSVMLYTSYIMLTNHESAIGALGDDRRVYVISNTLQPAPHEYFIKLNEWLGKKDEKGDSKWARSVWRFLQTLKPNVAKLNDRAPDTYAKRVMVEETKSLPDIIVHEVLKEYGFGVPFKQAKMLCNDIAQQVDPDRAQELTSIIGMILKKKTSVINTKANAIVKVDSTVYRCRANNAKLISCGVSSMANTSLKILQALNTESSAEPRRIHANYSDTVMRIAEVVENSQ